ncbi:hypothetical protein [Nonomuraea typhae]|uniref:Uncharacterized protein n=1 Tax=Nonomuraea typhae TaxID=2603600 RepID=A0ABW7Z6U8_9ACTN
MSEWVRRSADVMSAGVRAGTGVTSERVRHSTGERVRHSAGVTWRRVR